MDRSMPTRHQKRKLFGYVDEELTVPNDESFLADAQAGIEQMIRNISEDRLTSLSKRVLARLERTYEQRFRKPIPKEWRILKPEIPGLREFILKLLASVNSPLSTEQIRDHMRIAGAETPRRIRCVPTTKQLQKCLELLNKRSKIESLDDNCWIITTPLQHDSSLSSVLSATE